MKSFSALAEFLNLPELLDRVEGDEDLLRELLALFQEDLPQAAKPCKLRWMEAISARSNGQRTV